MTLSSSIGRMELLLTAVLTFQRFQLFMKGRIQRLTKENLKTGIRRLTIQVVGIPITKDPSLKQVWGNTKDTSFILSESPWKFLNTSLVLGRNQPLGRTKGWKFHYLMWYGTAEDPNNNFSRKFARRDNMFPEERKGKLDIFKLQQHGLTKDCIENGDDFFLSVAATNCS